MPIHHAIWRDGEKPTSLNTTRLISEQLLEDMIVRDPRILSSEWMLIGQQERTYDGGRIDLQAIAPDGLLVLIELKRDRTPREVVGFPSVAAMGDCSTREAAVGEAERRMTATGRARTEPWRG